MKKYTIYLLWGGARVIEGKNLINAIINSGYKLRALLAIDFYLKGSKLYEYDWDCDGNKWVKYNET